jgi:hypothetical protein
LERTCSVCDIVVRNSISAPFILVFLPFLLPFPFIGFPAIRRKGGGEKEKQEGRAKGGVSKVMEILRTHTEMTVEVPLSPTPISICLHFSPEQYPLRLSNAVVLRYKRPQNVHLDSPRSTSERASERMIRART